MGETNQCVETNAIMVDEDVWHARETRIAELEAALRKINAINDHPGRFSKEIQDVLDAVIDTSDVKFT